MDAISHLECKLNRLALTLCLSALPELLDEVLQQYTDTLCTAQKKMSFVNTLLQDITIFNSNTYHHQWDTPHRRSSSHRSYSAHSRDHSGSKPCTSHKTTCMTSSKPSYSSSKTAWKHKDKKYKQVTIDDSSSNYYSSDEPSSESDEDLN